VQVSKVYFKFSQFVQENQVMRDSFYPKENGFVSKEELANCFQRVGYAIPADDLLAICADFGLNPDENTNTNTKIEIRKLYEKLICWQDVLKKGEAEKLADLQMELLQDLDKKGNRLAQQEDDKQPKPQSAVGNRKRIMARPFSSSTKKSDTITGRSG
jgi:hypothetical protein